MKHTFFLSLFFLTTLAFAGKKYEDQVIERITCPTQKCEEGQTLDIEIPSMMEETAAEDIVKVDKGQTIYIHLNTYTDRTFKARVTKIYPGFNTDQQSYTVEAAFLEMPEKLFSGTQLQANVELSDAKEALMIPTAYLLPNNTVRLEDGTTKTIKVGTKDSQWVQVLGGISEQDVIIKNNNQ